MSPKLLPIDMNYVADLLVRLLDTPSPSGRTDEVMHLIGGELEGLGVPFQLTRRGALVADFEGEQSTPDRAIVVHSDTIGCLVKAVKDNGRLQVVPVGTFSSRFAEGARVTILTDDQATCYTGTVLPLLASGHTFGDAVDTQPNRWADVEVRIDEVVECAADTLALGIRIGDFVALDAQPVITPSGFVKSRHLDDKAGVAAAFGAIKAVRHHDVAEMLSIDNAVCAPGQASRETGVNVTMADSTGPLDYHLTRKMLRLCEQLGIPAQRDIFNFYRSDTAAAIEAGAEMRAALIGFGVDASHGHERTHIDGIRNVAELVAAYLQTPLTFAWDEQARGPLEDFPRQDDEPEITAG